MCTRKSRSVALLTVVFCVFTYRKEQSRLFSLDFGYMLPFFFLHLRFGRMYLSFWVSIFAVGPWQGLPQPHMTYNNNGANLPCIFCWKSGSNVERIAWLPVRSRRVHFNILSLVSNPNWGHWSTRWASDKATCLNWIPISADGEIEKQEFERQNG